MLKILYIIALLMAALRLTAQTFSSTVAQPIPDDGSTVAFEIMTDLLPSVADTSFGLVQVCLNMTHTWDSDMEVSLQAPDGTTFLLFAGVGGDGDGWQNCCLRADADLSIFNGSAPFEGIFRPMGRMGNVNNGQNPNGTWKLILHDTYAGADEGFLQDWSITFGETAQGPFIFPGTHLPLVHIHTNGQPIPDEPKVEATLLIIRHAGGQLNFPTDTEYEYEGNMFVELQGFTGVGYPKKNFDIDLTDTLGARIDTSLLGLPADNDWIFKAEYLDPTLMKNPVAYEFSRRMGRYAPRTMYCELFLNGEYQGVYNLTEKIKRGEDRVDIARLLPEDTTGQELTGGYIIEMNINGDPGSWNSQYLPINFSSNNLPVEFKYVYPKTLDLQPQQGDYIKSWVDSFEYTLHQPYYADTSIGYRKWINIGSFLDFMLVNEFSTNYDSYGRSTFLYKEKSTDGGLLHIGPPWDYDRAFCCPEDWVWQVTHPVWPFPDWWSIFHSDSLFLQERYCRWNDLRQTVWPDGAFLTYIDSLHNLLSEAAPRNFERWPELNYFDWEGNVAAMKDLLTARLAWMDGQITGQDCSEVNTVMEEEFTPQLFIHPNPANDQVQLSNFNGEGPVQILIYDRQGKRWQTSVVNSNSPILIHIQNWPAGIYFVEIISGRGRAWGKLVVQ